MVVVVFIVIALVVIAIALVVVGRVTAELAASPPQSYFDLDEAVTFVADGLPSDATAALSYDDVRLVLEWHLDYLEGKGVAHRGEPVEAPAGPLVADEDDAVAFVLGRAEVAGVDVSDVHVVQVLDGASAYLEAIGAIGGLVPAPLDPSS